MPDIPVGVLEGIAKGRFSVSIDCSVLAGVAFWVIVWNNFECSGFGRCRYGFEDNFTAKESYGLQKLVFRNSECLRESSVGAVLDGETWRCGRIYGSGFECSGLLGSECGEIGVLRCSGEWCGLLQELMRRLRCREVLVGVGDVMVGTVLVIDRFCGRLDGSDGIFGGAGGKSLFGWGG